MIFINMYKSPSIIDGFLNCLVHNVLWQTAVDSSVFSVVSFTLCTLSDKSSDHLPVTLHNPQNLLHLTGFRQFIHQLDQMPYLLCQWIFDFSHLTGT